VTRCAQWFRERLGETWRAWIAEEPDGTLCGCVFLRLVDKVPNPSGVPAASGHVTDLYVTPGYRGRGIGGALLAQVKRAGREQRLDTLVAWPSPTSAALYAREGFSEPAALLELPLDQGPVERRLPGGFPGWRPRRPAR
jgi:GNAT superfamily N-acetyltransferase